MSNNSQEGTPRASYPIKAEDSFAFEVRRGLYERRDQSDYINEAALQRNNSFCQQRSSSFMPPAERAIRSEKIHQYISQRGPDLDLADDSWPPVLEQRPASAANLDDDLKMFKRLETPIGGSPLERFMTVDGCEEPSVVYARREMEKEDWGFADARSVEQRTHSTELAIQDASIRKRKRQRGRYPYRKGNESLHNDIPTNVNK
ncbi:MAG: hypothetical protein M1827_004202 [Pycnora praestabilis]|nr:MAG: hypothetical protein M1827_004202 [Pycnora praestabilis]